jgi:hypothetical protein
MTSLRSVAKWIAFGALGLVASLMLLIGLMMAGVGPAADVLFGLAYCVDGYPPCGDRQD